MDKKKKETKINTPVFVGVIFGVIGFAVTAPLEGLEAGVGMGMLTFIIWFFITGYSNL